MRTLKLPQWTECLPNKTNISSKEIMDMLEFNKKASSGGCRSLIKCGLIPEPDIRIARKGKRPRMFWSLGKLRIYALSKISDT